MKSNAIALLNDGIEIYILILYRLYIPTVCHAKCQEAKYALTIELSGISVELVIKAY